jgi:GT2 family glycosyltransferase
VNPDIRLACNPFPSLVEALHRNEAGVAAPLVWNPQSELEDSFRRFPTPLSILYKALGKTPNNSMPSIEEKYICPDWVGGMFMLFPSAVFREIRGFDEHYFLYYEDVDLCARLHLSGLQVVVCTAANVVHAARRSSHGNTRYLRWHLKSMFRYFLSVVFLRAWWLRRKVRSHK